jgi:hypothetical protein
MKSRTTAVMDAFESVGLSGIDPHHVWDELWARSVAWDDAHTNSVQIWDAEADQPRIREAISLEDSSPERAFDAWLELAEKGSVWSMEETARRYACGIGVQGDAATADHWYRLASGAGSQDATLRWAEFARSRKDYAACEAIVQEAAREDWAPATFWLAWSRIKLAPSRQTYLAVKPLFERAAEQGHPGAQWWLAECMAKGRFGARYVLRGHKLFKPLYGAVVESMGADELMRELRLPAAVKFFATLLGLSRKKNVNGSV